MEIDVKEVMLLLGEKDLIIFQLTKEVQRLNAQLDSISAPKIQPIRRNDEPISSDFSDRFKPIDP